MKTKKYDSLKIGLLIGLLGPFAGFIIYGLGWSLYFNRTLDYFINDVFLGMSSFQSPIVSLSLLFNLIPFFLFLKSSRMKSARGVLMAIFIYVPVVVYLKFF